MSSGTTGRPIVGAYTRSDLDLWREVVARTLDAAQVGTRDVVQVAFGYGLFTGGLGFHYGAQELGAAVIPISAGNTRRQVKTLTEFGSTILCATPSYALLLSEHLQGSRELPLRAGFFGGEPWSDELRLRLETTLGIKAYDSYGLTELIGPATAAECERQDGLHVFEDLFYPEIIDPQTGLVVPVGQPGELVLSALTREATPLVRFRTHDMTTLIREPCPCGRTSRRISRVRGRTDDMLIVRGVNIFPQQVENALSRIPGLSSHFQIIVDRHGPLDSLDVQVERDPRCPPEHRTHLEQALSNHLRSDLGVLSKCTVVAPHSLPRSEGKARHVVDRRSIPHHR